MGEKIKLFLLDAIRRVDWVLLLCTTVLSTVSLVTVYGAVDNFGMSKLKMQFAMTVVGILLTFIVANLDYHLILDRLWLPLLIFSAGILGLTLVAGDTGAAMETAGKSWLTIPVVGIAIQPSEFVKITFRCTFAKHLHTVGGTVNKPRTLLGLCLHALLIVGLIHTGVTYCLYFSSLKELPGQKAAILSYIDPLVAVLVSVLFCLVTILLALAVLALLGLLVYILLAVLLGF